jgi:plasmid stability protein
MARRNLTIQLDEATIRRAKIIAAEHGISMGGLVAQQIKQMVAEADRYNVAREQILHHLKKPPFRLGGARLGREELHDRQNARLVNLQ